MAIDYHKTAEMLVHELGGDENISNVSHCATRLRFILKDESIVNKDKVAKITKAQLEEIAKVKMPDLNAANLESAMSMIAGTARSMGVTVEE